jgi:hypothetical protein
MEAGLLPERGVQAPSAFIYRCVGMHGRRCWRELKCYCCHPKCTPLCAI